MALITAGSRSGMGRYEMHDQLSEQFSSSVGSNREEIYSRQALYSSYTYHPKTCYFCLIEALPAPT